MHGKLGLAMNILMVRWFLDSHALSDQSILLECQGCSIKYSLGFFGIAASELNISIPGSAYDTTVHPSERIKTTNAFYLPHEAESMVGKARHPLIYIPSFKSEIAFVWNMLRFGAVSSDHHSPYLKKQSNPHDIDCMQSLDKFASFRSNGTCVEFTFDLPGSDLIGNWIALRIDVLPWFTHVNSTIIYSSKLEDNKAESFPPFQSVAIHASINELKVASWFVGDDSESDWDTDGLEGICLIVDKVNYAASVNGEKEIVVEGPVKAALLDVSEFSEIVDGRNEDDLLIEQVEMMASGFGAVGGDEYSNSVGISAEVEDTASPFVKLQDLSLDIHETDYVVIAGQIDIQNKSLESILAGSDETNAAAQNATDGVGEGIDKTTWSILVSRLKLLWTLEIRDNLMAISQDLIFTVGFMKSQLRQSQLLAEKAVSDDTDDTKRREEPTDSLVNLADEGIELSLQELIKNNGAESGSTLEYLLKRDASFDLDIHTHANEAHSATQTTATGNKTIPTIDIHFSNPQVQLHSKTTGGSVILAMEGAHVEGRKFVHLVTSSVTGKVSIADLVRKTGKTAWTTTCSAVVVSLSLGFIWETILHLGNYTEHAYTLTNMEAFALSTHVDVDVGLPWLEVSVPGSREDSDDVLLEERFGISRHDSKDSSRRKHATSDRTYFENHNFTYPAHLRHHEPLKFVNTGLLRSILDKFTFKSRQLFHRPPIHYSTDELVGFIKQGLVVREDDLSVDSIDIKIDVLNFNLDSYQFKTTIDLIRNVLLEPPKPHRRHSNAESKPTQHSSKRVSSVAAVEMEELLKSRSVSEKTRGKKGRDVLRNAAMGLLRDLEDRHAISGDAITRRISYALKKLKWCIQSPDEIDDIAIAFTGFFGQHDYSSDGSVSSQFSLEDVRVASSRPGPDSIVFSDPTSVIKSVLDERSPCERCGKAFDHSENDLKSCSFHTGIFESGAWTCCQSTNIHHQGCKSSPHSGKERAAIVRVDTLPRLVEGITLYTHFEVNIYPGIPHSLIVQVSKSLSRLFMSYFFIEDDDKAGVGAMSTISDVTGSTTETLSAHTNNTPNQNVRKSLIIGGKGSSPGSNRQTRDDQHRNGITEYHDQRDIKTDINQAELVFIKVWRVGYINVEVSLSGFRRLPQTSIGICVPAYSKVYKIGSWACKFCFS